MKKSCLQKQNAGSRSVWANGLPYKDAQIPGTAILFEGQLLVR
ncbi:hypothetical protein [Peribacillus glennii]|nr:hypothetical protein [Peribacillus glennii]